LNSPGWRINLIVKDKSFNQPQQPTQPDSGQEEWVTRKKLRELYPDLQDHQLRYWRDSGKINIQEIDKVYHYKVSEIAAQVEYYSRPKKRARYQYVAKKLANIDVSIFILIVALGLAFVYYTPWEKNKTYSAWEFWLPIAGVLFFVVVYLIGKGIMYLYRRFFRRGPE
jgi:hypothetical protein